MNINQILKFHCPRWDELPEKPMFNRQAVEFINKFLEPILDEEDKLTTTMVQNYVKWGIMPKESGRKYSRNRIAYLMVITIYKQAINLSNVGKGVELLLRTYPIDQAYNIFANALEKSLNDTFGPLKKMSKYHYENQIDYDKLGLHAVANSFAFKLLANIIIDSQGIKYLGEKSEKI